MLKKEKQYIELLIKELLFIDKYHKHSLFYQAENNKLGDMVNDMCSQSLFDSDAGSVRVSQRGKEWLADMAKELKLVVKPIPLIRDYRFDTLLDLHKAIQQGNISPNDLTGHDCKSELFVNNKDGFTLFTDYYGSSRACKAICELLGIEYSQE